MQLRSNDPIQNFWFALTGVCRKEVKMMLNDIFCTLSCLLGFLLDPEDGSNTFLLSVCKLLPTTWLHIPEIITAHVQWFS
jgi:hypothetical protein